MRATTEPCPCREAVPFTLAYDLHSSVGHRDRHPGFGGLEEVGDIIHCRRCGRRWSGSQIPSGGIYGDWRWDEIEPTEPSSVFTGAFLRYCPPFDWPGLLGHFAARALSGIEQVEDGVYRRTVAPAGVVTVRDDPARRRLLIDFDGVPEASRPGVLERIRRVFDVETDPAPIRAQVGNDPLLAPLLAQRPGLRVPGGWDGFELAVRAVLGQQVTLGAGKRLTERLVELCGETSLQPLSRCFPSPKAVLEADLTGLGMPGARRATLRAIAEAAVATPELFRERRGSIEESVKALSELRGVGDWTAHYIALRGLRDPDAFPASDIGLLRGATGPDGVRPTPDQLRRQAEKWRPWRAYAAQHLWAADANNGVARQSGPRTRVRR